MRKFIKVIQQFVLHFNVERLITFGYHSDLPQRQLIVGYATYAIAGLLLLTLPFATTKAIPLADNFFTAVSALSTTGLATVDVGKDYTVFGQIVILLLVQFGGLGYMTLSSFIMLGTTQHLGTEQSKMVISQFALPKNMDNKHIIRNIVCFTFAFEGLGILLLFPYFLMHDIAQPLWSAIFHSVSGFCTAGFSLYSDNLCQFKGDVYVNVVLMILSYMGAMGFIFMTDVVKKLIDRRHRISFTSKVIVKITGGLSLLSALHLYYVEPSIQSYPDGERFMVALFQSMSAMTTTGYNTIDLSGIVPLSLLVLSMTMYIGASPTGTGGGLKSTTISAVFAFTRSKLKQEKEVTLNGHIIPTYRLDTALTTIIFYSFILVIGVYAMTIFEPHTTDCQKLLFEGTSALATTGLSSGILTELTMGSKYVLIALMFIGRVGVITFGNALLINVIKEHKTVNKEDLVI